LGRHLHLSQCRETPNVLFHSLPHTACAEQISLTDISRLDLKDSQADLTTYRGKPALRSARGFIGVAFRLQDGGARFELLHSPDEWPRR
jgi:hypothetical protein